MQSCNKSNFMNFPYYHVQLSGLSIYYVFPGVGISLAKVCIVLSCIVFVREWFWGGLRQVMILTHLPIMPFCNWNRIFFVNDQSINILLCHPPSSSRQNDVKLFLLSWWCHEMVRDICKMCFVTKFSTLILKGPRCQHHELLGSCFHVYVQGYGFQSSMFISIIWIKLYCNIGLQKYVLFYKNTRRF